MFGYIRTDKGELKVREYELYRGLYCTLCKQLSKRYGVFSRFILSYDMTFLALVRLCEKGILQRRTLSVQSGKKVQLLHQCR